MGLGHLGRWLLSLYLLKIAQGHITFTISFLLSLNPPQLGITSVFPTMSSLGSTAPPSFFRSHELATRESSFVVFLVLSLVTSPSSHHSHPSYKHGLQLLLGPLTSFSSILYPASKITFHFPRCRCVKGSVTLCLENLTP